MLQAEWVVSGWLRVREKGQPVDESCMYALVVGPYTPDMKVSHAEEVAEQVCVSERSAHGLPV